MMEFFSSYEGVNDHLGYLRFVSILYIQCIFKRFPVLQLANSLDQPLVYSFAVLVHAVSSQFPTKSASLIYTYLSPSLNIRPQCRPPQEPHRRSNEDKHNCLVFGRISLEACCKHVLLFLSCADAIT